MPCPPIDDARQRAVGWRRSCMHRFPDIVVRKKCRGRLSDDLAEALIEFRVGLFHLTLPRRVARIQHNVRFGSKADMCSAKAHVCFGSKADICGVTRDLMVKARKKSSPTTSGFKNVAG